jgi:hypothetical protein
MLNEFVDMVLGEDVSERWKEFTIGDFIISVPRQIILGDRIKKNVFDRAYRRHGRR